MEDKQYRRKSRLLSQPSSPIADLAAVSSASPGHGHSPLRRKSVSEAPARKHRSATNDALIRGRWPSAASSSSSSKKAVGNSLADFLGHDRLTDLVEQKNDDRSKIEATEPQSISRQRSCSEFSRFGEEKDQSNGKIPKENRPMGGSMRYISKLRFPRSSSKPEPSQLPGRMSVDETALGNRRHSDFGCDFPSSESDRSESNRIKSLRIPQLHAQDPNPKSLDRIPTGKLAIRRTSSLSGYGSAATQWAMSPGRQSDSPPPLPPPEGSGRPSRSSSSLRPVSPDKGRKTGSFISNIKLDLFRRKSGSDLMSSNKSMPSSPSSTTMAGEMNHQFRLQHNRLIQWRFVNARSNGVNRIRMWVAESTLMSAWMGTSKLQASLMQKRMLLEKERLRLKFHTLIPWQIGLLEGWKEIERQHTSAISTTRDCLQAAVCRLPLVDGAKADPQTLSAMLRQSTNIAAMIQNIITTYTSMAQNTVPLLTELAQVVTKERILLEECLELLEQAYNLQIQEQSIRSHLVQLKNENNSRNPLMRQSH